MSRIETNPASKSVESNLIAAARKQAARATPASLPADSFPGYEINHELHRGGQGVVYLAHQKSTGRKVAIKVIRQGPFASLHDRARFDREVHVLAQIQHPSIVAIHDSGEAAGMFYFVMDYIAGQPLDQYMVSHGRDVKETLRLFQRICTAVNVAHLRGVIHRDLKPSNIRIDAVGDPHVLDFGLAKIINEQTGAGSISAMTMTGQFIGSLPWASPEQAEGAQNRVDVRSDVYSLGVILFQMLTAKFPYEVTGSMRRVMDNILTVPPLKPSAVRGQIDDEVETIILKCLAKEPERRYQSAGELARDVGRYLDGEPIHAKADSAWYLIRKSLDRYRTHVRFAMIGLIGIVALAGTMSVLWIQTVGTLEAAQDDAQLAASKQRIAERARDIALHHAQTARSVQAFLAGVLSDAAAQSDQSDQPDQAMLAALDNAAQRVDGEFKDDPLARATIHVTLASSYQSLGRAELASHHCTIAELILTDSQQTLADRGDSALAEKLREQIKAMRNAPTPGPG